MEEFFGAEDHRRYLAWLQEHPQGYVLQLNGPTDKKLHRATCRYVGGNGAEPLHGAVWTAHPKRCATDRGILSALATGECRVCKP